MISREEAIEELFGNGAIHDSPFDIVMKIYDSIGSCGECKYSCIEEYDDGFRLDDVLVCSRGSFNPIEADFFCADFERKEDDNNNPRA